MHPFRVAVRSFDDLPACTPKKRYSSTPQSVQTPLSVAQALGPFLTLRNDSGEEILQDTRRVKLAPCEQSVQAAVAVNCNYSMRLSVGMDRVLVVHLNSNTEKFSVDHLLQQARVAIPGILNFIFFRRSVAAVLYLGKTRHCDGKKYGIVSGAEELKHKLIRFMTGEIWPPLRTDIPDDSNPINFGGVTAEKRRRNLRIDDMQALVYIKQAEEKTKYIKVVLRGGGAKGRGQLHFDVTDTRDEKYRWENRKLHIRVLDNLETQKAIFSYEEYMAAFETALQFSSRFEQELKRCINNGVATCFVADEDRHYTFFDHLQQPESATLDYKSYFSEPAKEIKERATKFMCGFLNAYGHGKLVIGVHEMPTALFFETTTEVLVRNDSMEQIVVGVTATKEEIENDVAPELAAQLRNCIPPIPPNCVRIDVVPVRMPFQKLDPCYFLFLFELPEEQTNNWKDIFKQKSNFAIRVLSKYHMSLCPVSFDTYFQCLPPDSLPLLPNERSERLEVFMIMPSTLSSQGVLYDEDQNQFKKSCDCLTFCPPSTPRDTNRTNGWQGERELQQSFSTWNGVFSQDEALLPLWLQELLRELGTAKGRGRHFVTRVAGVEMPLPQTQVIEVSVDVARAGSLITGYRGKFFNGWPSIPIWDLATHSVRRVDRSLHILDSSLYGPECHSCWLDESIVGSIVAFLYRSANKRVLFELRLLNTVFNRCFLVEEGDFLVTAISHGSGAQINTVAHDSVNKFQLRLKATRMAMLPLLLCWVYERIGNLPSPYPFVAVPMELQLHRAAAHLVPIFYRAGVSGGLSLAVVLDIQDGLLKTVSFRENGEMAAMLAVQGVGFEQITSAEFANEILRRKGNARFASQRRKKNADPSKLDSETPPPLVRFCFLHGEEQLAKDGAVLWELRNLLIWFEMLHQNPFVQRWGFCGRFLVFVVEDIVSDICCEHYVCESPQSPASAPSSEAFPSSFDCALHRATFEWTQWK